MPLEFEFFFFITYTCPLNVMFIPVLFNKGLMFLKEKRLRFNLYNHIAQ